MKFKSLFLTVVLSAFFINSFSFISSNKIKKRYLKEEVNEILKLDFIELRSLDGTKVDENVLSDEKIKYISLLQNGVNYGVSAFYAADYFFLGADDAQAEDYALMRAKVNSGEVPSFNTLEFVPLAPKQVYLNGIKENGTIVKKNNPIYNKRIDKLALQGRNIVLTSQDITTVEDTNFDAGKRICLIDNIDDGSSVRTNEIEINDADGNCTDGVVGLAATTGHIFAAVKQNGGNFGGGNGGFAVLIQKDSKLYPVDATTGDDGNKAVKLDLTKNQLLAIEQDVAQGITLGNMHWDSNINRLFIGLIGVERSGTNAEGGAVSVLVGRLDKNKLIIEPVLNLNLNLFNENSTDYVLGFYSTNNVNLKTNSYKLKTMKTSTNKNYLIVNGITDKGDKKNDVFAFPILGTTKSDGTAVSVADVGKIADKQNREKIVQNKDDMHLYNEKAVCIGTNSLCIESTADVQDIFVVNDSVFTCVAENRSDTNHEAGIFRSTALFDSEGNIRAWSPWQRVMGTVDKVYGAGVDLLTGNYWYFTETAGIKNTINVSQWGKSSVKTGLMGNGLVELLSDEFAQVNAGIHQVFNFDDDTPGIKRDNPANKMSFMVALGYKKVALIETGKYKDNAFTPESNFGKNTNVFIIEDTVLNDLGPISCADISRRQVDNSGWLFVGGHNGLAVWRNNEGNGWDGQVNSDKVNFSNPDFSFKKLGTFSQVRKIVCDGDSSYAYIMTIDNIYRFNMLSNKFSDDPEVLDEKLITPPPGYLLDMIKFYRNQGDTRLLVATTLGLFYSDTINDDNAVKNPIWTQVALNSGALLDSPVMHLSFVGTQKGGFTTDGNVYALSADLSLNKASVYRFDIHEGNIRPISEGGGSDYFYSFGELRTNFITDGAFGFSMLPKHFEGNEFLRLIRMTSGHSLVRGSERVVNLDLGDNAYNVGILVQNTASGGWIVPGDWGIRVNE